MATTRTEYGVARSDRPTQPYSETVHQNRSWTELDLKQFKEAQPDWEFGIVTRTIVTSDWEEVK